MGYWSSNHHPTYRPISSRCSQISLLWPMVMFLGIHTVTMGPHISNPTYASPTLHTAPLPQIPFILTLTQDCTQGLNLSHLLHHRQTTTSHTSMSCHSHRIAHAERVEHRRGKLKNRWEMLR